ncbi:MAG: hypothetical protein VYA55_01290 [Pseudomonadota bacterium]|nr:hypothetical protein [Pseudomonadota bacterium]
MNISAMKTVALQFGLSLLLANLSFAEGGPQGDIQTLLDEQNIVVGWDPEQLIHGTNDIILSRGTWSDSLVAAYTEKYRHRPLVLPLSGPRMADRSELDAFSHTQHSQVYYLYLRLPDAAAQKEETVKKLEALLQPDFQDKLKEYNLYQTPEHYQRLWRVRLGLLPAQFSGGDY